MDNSMQISSTSQARTSANTLSNDATFYTDLVAELKEAQTQISANWEGESADIADIVSRINTVCLDFEQKIVPSLTNLSSAIVALAEDIDATANSTVESGNASVGGGDSTSAPAGAATTAANSKPGFWEYHGQDFADDWDFSGCDSGLDYVGAAVGGLCGTVGSVVNFAVDGASEILGWLFG